MIKMRKPMTRKGSRRLFTKGIKTERSNVNPRPMRGGIRL